MSNGILLIRDPVTGLQVGIPADFADQHQMPAGNDVSQDEFNTLLIATFERWLNACGPDMTIDDIRGLVRIIKAEFGSQIKLDD